MRQALAVLGALLLVPLTWLLALIPLCALALTDIAWLVFGRRRLTPDRQPRTDAASVVIPNWNGRDLLEKYLPSVVTAMQGHPENEVIVVDNGSTDGSAEYVREQFPAVRLLALPENLGFGGGSNAGFRAAKNDIVVLLNSDMRVRPDFLRPLLLGFTDPLVFAVSCQIFFSDPNRAREETGLTQARWSQGMLRVRHRLDDQVQGLYPCFYGGGGSCAFDREKFLQLGGFDEILAPFYLEDTDLGFLAWKRGWKVLYEPESIVFHEHRGTIGRKFRPEAIRAVLEKNFLLFCWKNIHEWKRLLTHFFYVPASASMSLLFGPSPERSSLRGQWRALKQLPGAMRSRWRARRLAAVSDTEAFRRPQGGYYRDRFESLPAKPEPLRVLFVSPYAIYPPTHGGAVFMYQTLQELAKRSEVHVVTLLDFAHEAQAHAHLTEFCASLEYMVRMRGQPHGMLAAKPHAVMEFANEDLAWLIHRQMYLKKIDVVQLEYTQLAQYAGAYRRLACFLFEHDIYFQSIARGLPFLRGYLARAMASVEYLRALHFEMAELPKVDRVQVCTPANKEFLTSYLPDLAERIDDRYRAGIQTADYVFTPDGREPETLLFLGSFRHQPNTEAVQWFCREVLPLVLARRPQVKLILIGSDPPPRYALPGPVEAIELRGFVEDIREPLRRYSVFVCPILSGSGVRVKLLEAFAAGIPVVSTRIGAEGLASEDGGICRLADNPHEFADRVVALLEDSAQARELAAKARAEVEERWDMARITAGLVESYRQEVARKRGGVGTADSAATGG